MNQPYQQPQSQGFGFNVLDYEAQKAFDNLPLGWYNILITGSEMKGLDNGNGTKLANEYTVFGGAFNDRKLFENLNIIHDNEQAQEISRKSLRAIGDALLKPINGPLDLIQAYMCVKVGIDKPKKEATEAEKLAFEPRNVIRGYKPFDQALHQTNSQVQQQGGAPANYNVQVTPQGNAAPQFNPQQLQQSPQYAPQQQQQAAPQYNQQQQAPQQAPQQQYQQQPQQQQAAPQQQQQPQQAPQQQATPQQQYAPQQQQQYAPMPDNGNALQQQPNMQQQPPANAAPGAMGQDGQQYQATGAPNAGQQPAPPATFAPQQNGQSPAGNVPPPQQSQQGNAMPPGNAQPPMNQQPQQQQAPQQQQQAPNQPQMAAPNQNFAPPGTQQPGGTPPPPGGAW